MKHYKYRIKCITDAKNEYTGYLSEDLAPPTTCPTNTAHTIDSGSVVIVDTISKNVVKIQEESTETGGNYGTESIVLLGETGPNVTTEKDTSWPFPISVLDIQYVSTAQNEGDEIDLSVGPNTIVGYLTADGATGATGLSVSQTVMDNSMIGYYIDLFNGASTESLGRITSMDKVNNKIYCENTPSQSWSSASPTYVRQTVYIIHDYTIGPPQRYPIGGGKIGGSYVPTGTIIRAHYHNKSDTPKTLTATIEYLY